jgi:hypothetical protein
MQVAKQLSQTRIWIVPGTNVSTMDVDRMVDFLLGKAQADAATRPAK